MKTKMTFNLIFVFTLVFFNSNIFATNNPTSEGDEKVSIVMLDGPSGLITQMTFNESSEQMDIMTAKKIVSIQLVDANQNPVFFLPVVGSNELNVGLSQFEEGTYFLKMLIDGEQDYVTAELNKKI